jgi:hypothetical protein
LFEGAFDRLIGNGLVSLRADLYEDIAMRGCFYDTGPEIFPYGSFYPVSFNR